MSKQRRIIITPEQDAEIRFLAKTMNFKDVAKQMELNYHTFRRYCHNNKIIGIQTTHCRNYGSIIETDEHSNFAWAYPPAEKYGLKSF